MVEFFLFIDSYIEALESPKSMPCASMYHKFEMPKKEATPNNLLKTKTEPEGMMTLMTKSLSFTTTYIYFIINHCIQGVLKVHYLKTIPTSMELRFWNQAAVVSTAEIFTLSACTTAGIGGAT